MHFFPKTLYNCNIVITNNLCMYDVMIMRYNVIMLRGCMIVPITVKCNHNDILRSLYTVYPICKATHNPMESRPNAKIKNLTGE